MTQEKQQELFHDALDDLIDRFQTEYDLTTYSAVGILEAVKFELLASASLVVVRSEDPEP